MIQWSKMRSFGIDLLTRVTKSVCVAYFEEDTDIHHGQSGLLNNGCQVAIKYHKQYRDIYFEWGWRCMFYIFAQAGLS